MQAELAKDVCACWAVGVGCGHSLWGLKNAWLATNPFPQIPEPCPMMVTSEPFHKSIRALGKPDEPGWDLRVNIKQANKPRQQNSAGCRETDEGDSRHVAVQRWNLRSI